MSNKNHSSVNAGVVANSSDKPLDATHAQPDLTDEQAVQLAAKLTENKDVVAEVLKGGKLQRVKASLRKREWIDIVGAGLIAGVGVGAAMVVSNKVVLESEGEEGERFSNKEIAILSGVAAVGATTLRGVLDFIPAVNHSPSMGLLVTSLCANASVVATTAGHEKILGLVNGKVSVDVEALAEEA